MTSAGAAIAERDRRVPPPDRFDFDLALAMAPPRAAAATPGGADAGDGPRREPVLAASPRARPWWVALDDTEPAGPAPAAPVLIGFGDEESEAAGAPADPWPAAGERDAPAPATVVPASRAGIVTSLGLHLAVVLLLVQWTATPIDAATPIPVALVIEQPPPPPPVETPRPPGRLASENMGQPVVKPSPAAPHQARVAAIVPPKPAPPPLSRPPQAAAKPSSPAAAPRPDIRPAAQPVPSPAPERRPITVPGPTATRDEYLAYLVALTRRHLNLLPLSLVGQRRGTTILHLLILGDGTIARINLVQSSGYPDIDERIEQIVVAVRRFPPLPQWFQEPRMELNLRLRFPDALEE